LAGLAANKKAALAQSGFSFRPGKYPLGQSSIPVSTSQDPLAGTTTPGLQVVKTRSLTRSGVTVMIVNGTCVLLKMGTTPLPSLRLTVPPPGKVI
jgi:hypothetical protein